MKATTPHPGMEADFGSGKVWRVDTRVREESVPAVRPVLELLTPLGVELGDNEGFGGADLSPMRRLGMPIFSPVLPCRALVSLDGRGARGWALQAKLEGEPFDPDRHPYRTQIKGITWHGLILEQTDRGDWRAVVVLDV